MFDRDPYGKDPHEPGAKLDEGKATYGLTLGYFKNALAKVNEVSEFGRKKYTSWGWESVPDGQQRYTEGLLRHMMAELAREEIDPDSGYHHAAHAAWNALARLELMCREADYVAETMEHTNALMAETMEAKKQAQQEATKRLVPRLTGGEIPTSAAEVLRNPVPPPPGYGNGAYEDVEDEELERERREYQAFRRAHRPWADYEEGRNREY